MYNRWLIAAGGLSAMAAILHIGIIFGGPSWYRFFGAGKAVVRFSESNPAKAAAITFTIAATLGVWAAIAFSGAGVIVRVPLLRPALVAICLIYALRAAALPLMLRYYSGGTRTFLIWSSAIVLAIAFVHAVGIWTNWTAMAPAQAS